MADPTALYSYKGDSPTTLPYKIRLSDGRVRTDVSSFSDEEIADAGYTGPYTVPSHNNENQRVVWDSSNLAFVVEDIPTSELWAEVRAQRNRLLSECDWVMTVDAPGDHATNNVKEWELYRQRLRDITKESDPSSIIWPVRPDNEGVRFDATPVDELKLRHRVEDLESRVTSLQEAIEALTPSPLRVEALEAKVTSLQEAIEALTPEA